MRDQSAGLWLAAWVASGAIFAVLFAIVWGSAMDATRGLLLAVGAIAWIVALVVLYVVQRRLHWR